MVIAASNIDGYENETTAMMGIGFDGSDASVLVRGTLRGMNREMGCDVLLCEERSAAGKFSRNKPRSMPAWTILRAPLDLPDGDYTVTTSHGHVFHAKRADGFWLHKDADVPPRSISTARISSQEFRRWWLLATGADVQSQQHVREDARGKAGRATHRPFAPTADLIRIVGNRHAALLFLATVGLLYALPTMMELVAAHHAASAMDIIVFGDLTGCVCLALLFGMPMTGVVLYLLLAAVEGFLCFAGILSASTVAWFADLLPMVIAVRRIAVLRAAERPS